MAEWLCSGLQLRVRRFDSDPSLHFFIRLARVAELVDAADLKSAIRKGVWVQVPPRAPTTARLSANVLPLTCYWLSINHTHRTPKEEKQHNPRLQLADKRSYVDFMLNLQLLSPKPMDIAVPANQSCGKY